MKAQKLFVGMTIMLGAFAGCSKQDSQSTTINTPPTPPAASADDSPQGSVALRNVYSIQLNGGDTSAAFLLTELENNGKTSIKAFQGKWTMTDDLDNKVADDEIQYTSDTQFATTNGLASAHSIAPGEVFVIVEQSVTGSPDKVYVTSLELAGQLMQMYMGGKSLDDFKATKKTTFELEKIVLN